MRFRFHNLDEVERFLMAQSGPRNGTFQIDGETIQVLDDPFGRLSPEVYTLVKMRRRIRLLEAENARLERESDEFMRERDLARLTLGVASGAVEVDR